MNLISDSKSTTPEYVNLFQGCYDKLVDYLEQNGLMIGTAAVVVGLFMVRYTSMFPITSICYVNRKQRRSYTEANRGSCLG